MLLEIIKIQFILLLSGNGETLIGEYCGRKSISDIKSSSNEVFVYFKTNNKVKQYNGFNLFYNTSNKVCGGSLTTDSGYITSPGYPTETITNVQCEWTISVPKGRRIKVDIIDFDLANDFSQGLAFFSGDVLSSFVIHLKVKDKKKVVRSSDNIMQIFFWSGKSSNNRGFKAMYTSMEPSVCEGNINEPSGTINTPNDTIYYCVWKRIPNNVTRSQQQTIAFTINVTFPAQTTLRRANGLINLYTGYGQSKTLIASISKPIAVPVIKRFATPEITLTVTSAKEAARVNFTIDYKTYNCGGRISNSLGYIASPSFPAASNSNVECAWLLEASPNQILQIHFIHFDLGGSCDKAFLSIYNGDGPKHPKIGKYCENAVLPIIKSQTNKLWIEYHYETESHGKGFNFTYEPIAKGCGGILHQTDSIIETVNYPNNYPNNAECLWELRVKAGYHISFNFIDRFQIESSDNCKNDYVQLFNHFNETATAFKYCGRTLPSMFNSNSNILYVLFRSNDRVTGTGFRAQWKLGCGGIFMADEEKRYLISPGYPKDYENGLNCNYTIVAPRKYITIEFEDFELEDGGCAFDKVVIYKKLLLYREALRYPAMVEKTTYCGTDPPRKFRLLSTVTILFSTDKWIRKRGFKLSYTTTTCGGIVNNPTTIQNLIEPTKGYSFYDQGPLKCIWNIQAPKDKRATITFTNVTLTYSTYYLSQFIRVFDSNQVLAKISGGMKDSDLPIVINSNTNSVQVEFTQVSSTYLKSYGYFQADIAFTYGPSGGCGGYINFTNDIDNKVIELDPPGDNYSCTWKFNTTLGYRFKIEVLPIENNCKNVKNSTDFMDDCKCIQYQARDGLKLKSDLIFSSCHEQMISADYYTSGNFGQITITGAYRNYKPNKFKIIKELGICGNLELRATSLSSFITSPLYPSSYPKGMRCVWQIKSTLFNHRIIVVLKEIKFGQNITGETCGNNDRIEIVDKEVNSFHLSYDVFNSKKITTGPSSFNVMYGSHKFCNDNDEGYEFYSESNQIQVSFFSNNLVSNPNSKGFKLEYKIASCNRNYTTPQGRIAKNWYIGACSIYIIVPKNYTISLYFNKFTSISSLLSKNFIEIYDGDETKTKLLKTRRNAVPLPIFSTGNQLFIKRSNTSLYGVNAFDITYTSTDKGRGCGGDIYNFKGVFTSPLYPNPYTQHVMCVWNLKVPLELEMALRFPTFNIIGACNNNYLKVTTFVDNQPNEHRFCSNDEPATLISNVKMRVEYVSSIANTGAGWTAEFMAISQGTSGDLFNQ